MPLSETTLQMLRMVHVFAAILFVGNVIVTGVWSALLFGMRAQIDFRHAARGIVVTDWVFTAGGAALLVTSGVALAIGRGYPMWTTPWIRNAMIGLAVSTALWLVVLVPAQRRMRRLGPADDAELARTYHRWNVTGWLAVVPVLWSLWNMVNKPG
jgi:uncharacterized membrane protein